MHSSEQSNSDGGAGGAGGGGGGGGGDGGVGGGAGDCFICQQRLSVWLSPVSPLELVPLETATMAPP